MSRRQVINGNTRLERLGMWFAFRVLGGYGSPTLKHEGLRPTLRWVLTGRSSHARKARR